MLKSLFWLPNWLILRYGSDFNAGILFAHCILLLISAMALAGGSQTIAIGALSTSFVYFAAGNQFYRALHAQVINRRIESIRNNKLLLDEDELRSQFARRRSVKLTILYGQGLADVRNKTQGNASHVIDAAGRIAHEADALAIRAEEIAAMLEETAAGMEEFAVVLERSAAACKTTHERAGRIVDLAENGVRGVARLVEQMASTRQFAGKVKQTLKAIDEIAVQINILALNASIEAARAGDNGRAFAVVATEVRKLALRTSASTNKVQSVLDEALEFTESGEWLASDATKGMNSIMTAMRSYARLIGDISTTAAEQSAGVEQIKMAVEQMADMTQRNSADADSLKSISMEIHNSARLFGEKIQDIHRFEQERIG